MVPDPQGDQAVGRAYLCPSGRELRITRRCLEEDLRMASDAAFADALAHEIVRAFRNRRRDRFDDTKTVGPAAGPRTLYRLAHRHRHRGATWYDEELNVVWLCAYGYHESGTSDDAFPYFRELIEAGRIMPTQADRDGVADDRAERLAAALPAEAQRLLEEARVQPDTEVRGTLGSAGVGVVVVVVETLEETHVAIIGTTSKKEIYAILAAFFPQAEVGEWSTETKLPTRELDWEALESCWYILHGNA
jgi:hypothetical protein